MSNNHSSTVANVSCRQSFTTALRRMYFAAAAESAQRYQVSFDAVLLHLWRARKANRQFRISSVQCIEDLVHAVACANGDRLAWVELVGRFEHALVRHCRVRLDDVEAVMLVRRLFAEVKQRSCELRTFSAHSLRAYCGDRPLRTWLGDRTSALLMREAIMHARKKSSIALDRRHGLQIDGPMEPLIFTANVEKRTG